MHCEGVVDDVEHTFFVCPWYSGGPAGFQGQWQVGNVVPEMLRSAETWYSVAEYVRATLIAKKEWGFLESGGIIFP